MVFLVRFPSVNSFLLLVFMLNVQADPLALLSAFSIPPHAPGCIVEFLALATPDSLLTNTVDHDHSLFNNLYKESRVLDRDSHL